MNPALKALIPSKATVAKMMPKPAPTNPRGRMAPLSDEDVSRILAMRNSGMALQDIAEATGRHLNTVWLHVSRAVARGDCAAGRMTRRAKP